MKTNPKKIILVGASGTIGRAVKATLSEAGHELITANRSSGDFRVEIDKPASVVALYRQVHEKHGAFDAVAVAAGEVAFKPLAELSPADWHFSLTSKFLGQVSLVREALPYIREGGSFTLISGILSREPIRLGAAASAVNRAIEGFAMAAATELPKGLRINVVSPTVLEESLSVYGDYFAGFEPVSGRAVGEAYLKAICGAFTGQTLPLG
jgi:NAD(P)-dependent dehydrogenase (short-subunit alcohol dehydrogenase family)